MQASRRNEKETTRRRSGVFIDKFEYISYLFLIFLLLTLNKQMLTGSVVGEFSRYYNIFNESFNGRFPNYRATISSYNCSYTFSCLQ